MQHRAVLPAVFHRRVFNERRQLFTDAVTQRIGLLVFTVPSRNACFLAQHVYRFGQTVHAKHRYKTIGINQPLFHQEAILKEAGLLIQEIAAGIDDGHLLLAVMREGAAEEVFH